MLNKDSLSQLKQLKSDIRENNPRFKAIVKGTKRRFGFAVLQDKRELLIPPADMERLFPGDKITITVKKDDKGKEVAVIESFDGTDLKRFNGRVCFKKNNSFVIPDKPDLSRWIFIPPKQRANCEEGDFVECEIVRHPFKTSKPQAKIVNVFGSIDKPGVESSYIKSKFKINGDWPADLTAGLREHCEQTLEAEASADNPTRTDLSALPFVTIDSAATQDIDDALYAEPLADQSGWCLYVAISDPTAFVSQNSKLEQLAEALAISTYLPGDGVAMLPPVLSSEFCSLQENQPRLTLCCKMHISTSGEISHTEFINGFINSRAKLSYQQVATFLQANSAKDGEQALNEEIASNLHNCLAIKNALLAHRNQAQPGYGRTKRLSPCLRRQQKTIGYYQT